MENEIIYKVLVLRKGYKARVPYVGSDRTVALTIAQAYIARGEDVELKEVLEGDQKCKKK